MRPLLRAWKERGARPAAALAAALVTGAVERPAADVITHMPPDAVRQLERGEHPAPALARVLAREWGLEASTLLARRRVVDRQAGLPLDRRRANVRGAFVATARPPGHVLLVDDVYTTGATADAAASALRAAGARRVDVLTFARAVRL